MTDAAPISRPTGAAPSSFAHLPELDGLRAVAVIAVVLFHTWPTRFGGGFIGVDVFFVISGFLITSLLVGEHRGTGTIDLPAFWGRRVRRLAPAVVVLVVVCAVVVHLIGDGSALGLADSVGALTWTQNWVHLAVSTSTWAMHDTNTVLDHLWSLAIEEQFYLVWPLVLFGLLRFTVRRGAHVAVVIVLIAASATVMGSVGQTAAYFRTDARAFELLGGALLALSGWRPDPRIAQVLAAVGLGAIAVFTFTGLPGDSWLYPWGFLGATAVFAGLVSATTCPPAWLSTVLGRPAQAIGRVSYGIYLWHIPVLRIVSQGRFHLSMLPLTLLRVAVLSGVVWASYRFVEQPVRSRRWPLTPWRVAVVLVVVVAGLVPLGFDARVDFRHQWDASGMPRGTSSAARVLIVGDGVAGIVARQFPRVTTWDTSQAGCGLLPGAIRVAGQVFHPDVSCTQWRQRWADAIDQFRPTTVVVVETTWDLMDRVDGARSAALAARIYPEAARILGRRGARVVWVDPFDPSGVAPVPSAARAARAVTATALTRVVQGLHDVRGVAFASGGTPLSDDGLKAAASRLSSDIAG